MHVATFLGNECDFVTNSDPAGDSPNRCYPLGMDTQVFRYRDLLEVGRIIQDPVVREHVSVHFYEHPELYRILRLFPPPCWEGAGIRLVFDYPEDHEFLNQVCRRAAMEYGEDFGLDEIMKILRRDPALHEINRQCEERSAR